MSERTDENVREKCISALAASLPSRANLVARLIYRYLREDVVDLNPASAGVLASVLDQPRRITDLAELEGQTQPYVTNMVADLEVRGWVVRTRDAADRRVVYVTITEAGREMLSTARGALRDLLTARMATLSDEQLNELNAANDALQLVIETLQQAVTR